jgi:DNA invertase Pin-like site-specific DNA recombinase
MSCWLVEPKWSPTPRCALHGRPVSECPSCAESTTSHDKPTEGERWPTFRSLGDPLWDTSSPQGRQLSTLLAAIAEFERELIRERTGAGRKRAMANGVKFGRKRKLSDYQRIEAMKRRASGETLASIAKSYAVDISMISRL